VIVDTSALIAMLRGEAKGPEFLELIDQAESVRLSAATYLETGIVIDAARDPIYSRKLDDLLATVEAIIEPVTEAQARIARWAYRDFGKGSGHPAKLNFGDCFAYALAKTSGEPLLFKGDDFGHTDVRVAK
jgi:ribonuclease VapC